MKKNYKNNNDNKNKFSNIDIVLSPFYMELISIKVKKMDKL